MENQNSSKTKMNRKFPLSTSILLLVPASFLALVWLQTLLSQERLVFSAQGVEGQYALLAALIFIFLSFSALAVVWLLKKYQYHQKPWVVLVAAYGLPLLATIISYFWLQLQDSPVVAGSLGSSFFRATWQPFFYFWMAMVLFFSIWLLFPVAEREQMRIEKNQLLPALLTGLGCGLVSIFIVSVLLNWSSQAARPLAAIDPPSVLRWVTIAASLSLAPFALEGFFRQVLLQRWQTAYGEKRGFWLVAGLFALSTLQPALWLPGLISGALFARLSLRYSAGGAVIAHFVCNAVLLIAGWQWVI